MRLTRRGRGALVALVGVLVLVVCVWAGAKDASNMRYWQDCTTAGTCPGP